MGMMIVEIKQHGISISLFNMVLGDFEQNLVSSIVGYWFCDRTVLIKSFEGLRLTAYRLYPDGFAMLLYPRDNLFYFRI
ncbi:hypothetical protein [Candidatus Liberibacter sp.]|uniref:hypothetical protein n=1 Tax=Candidatus Liberibacter sp. TaxID=34022 RepID=UPI0015F572EF|nr:hypothetical protein [Candidatus Liberibacter sp.]MBA5724491.1 hypothetical protein [Candidatus Liberibacter sp.]